MPQASCCVGPVIVRFANYTQRQQYCFCFQGDGTTGTQLVCTCCLTTCVVVSCSRTYGMPAGSALALVRSLLIRSFYILLTVHHVMILGKWPARRTILFYVFKYIEKNCASRWSFTKNRTIISNVTVAHSHCFIKHKWVLRSVNGIWYFVRIRLHVSANNEVCYKMKPSCTIQQIPHLEFPPCRWTEQVGSTENVSNLCSGSDCFDFRL